MKSNFWRSALLAALIGALLLAAGLLVALNHVAQMPVHIMVNGVEMEDVLMPGHQLVLAVGLAALLLLALLLVPVVLLVLVLCVALPVGLALGITVLVPALLVVLFLGPPLLIVWGLWRLLRRRPDTPVAATIQP
jgi:hypothetical protein